MRAARLISLSLALLALTLLAVARCADGGAAPEPLAKPSLASSDAGPERVAKKRQLRGERKLTGRVLDDRNQPLQDAELRVTSLDDEDALPWTTRSDREGRFAFDDLVAHALVVEVTRVGHDAAERMLRADDAGELVFSLPRQGQLLVTVRDTPGNSVEGALVILTGPGLWPALERKANAHGEALFENLAFGEYRARARLGPRAATSSDKARVVPGQRAALALTLGAALTLNAQVVDRTSQSPLAEVEVLAYDPSPAIAPRSARSDANGKLGFDGLLAGTIRLELRHPGHAAKSVDVSLPRAETLKVELDGEAKLSGRVLDEQGRPVAGALLSVATQDGLPVTLALKRADEPALTGELGVTKGPVPKIPIFGSSEAALGTLACESDGQGAFEIGGLAPVPIVLRAVRAGYTEASLVVAELAPHRELGDLRVVLRTAGRVEGTIRDARGRGVAGVYVSGRGAGQSEQSTISDAAGQFALRDVLGEVSVSAEPQGYAALSCQLQVSAGATVRCDLTVGSTLYALPVRVVDEFGFGLEGVVLSLSAKTGARTFTQVTRRDGSALLRELPEPPYQVEAALTGFVSQSSEVLEPERELRIKLVHAATLSGIVTDSLGRPVPGAMVSTDEGDATTSSDARGNFVLDGVTPGALYVLAAHQKVGEGVSPEVRARGGETLSSLRIVLSGRYLPSVKDEPGAKDEPSASADPSESGRAPKEGANQKRPTSSVRRTKASDFALSQRGNEIMLGEVLAGGAMERAGARAGDVLISIDGEQVLSAAQGRGMLRDPPGHYASLRLLRERAELRVRYLRPAL